MRPYHRRCRGFPRGGRLGTVLECVVNVSEGRDAVVLDALRRAVAGDLLDVHSDADHNRSVYTLVGEDAPRALMFAAVGLVDISAHRGVHPRIGAVDVVPFVPLAGSTINDAVAARDRFAAWAADELSVPCFLYGPERSLPDIRRTAWHGLAPDHGPASPHPRAGAVCVGARDVLVAYNLWLRDVPLAETKRIAAVVRTPEMRTLGLQVGDMTQVSMNLVQPWIAGPTQAWDAVSRLARIDHAELVGLVPQFVLESTPRSRWEELDLSEDRSIEWRLANRSA